MTDDLLEKLDAIYTEKLTKIIPENIRKDITIFDVTGTYGESGLYKIYDSVDEMEADTSAQEGATGIVIYNPFEEIFNNESYTNLYFPKYLYLENTETIAETFIADTAVSSTVLMTNSISIELSSTDCIIKFKVTSLVDIIAHWTSTDGHLYTRTTASANYNMGKTSGLSIQAKFKNLTDVIKKFIKGNTSNTEVQIASSIYEKIGGAWRYKEMYSANYFTTADNVAYGCKAYTNDGLVTGTMRQDVLFDTQYITNTSSSTTNADLLKKCITGFNAEFDLTGSTNICYFLDSCTNLTGIPTLTNTSGVLYAVHAFSNLGNITSLPSSLDLSGATNLDYMCENSSFTTIPVLDLSSATSMNNIFSGCSQLSETSLNNIMATCTNGTSLSAANKTLRYLGLSSTQATTCQGLSNYSDFVAAGWSTGY